VNLTGGDQPERVTGSFVTANMFGILGATPAQGRFFTAEETQVGTRQPVAVITDDFWHTRFGGRPDIIGRTLVLNGVPFTVVGIARPGLLAPLGTPDVWMPIGYYPNAGDLERRGRPGVLIVGRLKQGVSVQRAQADLDAIAQRIAQTYPATNAGVGANVEPMVDQMVGPVRTPMLIVLGAVGIVLLIACANVANLQLARAAARRRELSVRTALGAGRSRLVRQLLTESIVLSVAGGALGILLARWGVAALATEVSGSVPVNGTIGLDGFVLLFASTITLGAGLLFGSAPAWQYSRADVQEALTVRAGAGAARGNRFGMRGALVVAQIALSVVLLVGAGLLTRSLAALSRVDPGFDPSHALTLQFRLPVAKYKTDAQIADMFTRTLEEMRRSCVPPHSTATASHFHISWPTNRSPIRSRHRRRSSTSSVPDISRHCAFGGWRGATLRWRIGRARLPWRSSTISWHDERGLTSLRSENASALAATASGPRSSASSRR
jgi:predicted permease